MRFLRKLSALSAVICLMVTGIPLMVNAEQADLESSIAPREVTLTAVEDRYETVSWASVGPMALLQNDQLLIHGTPGASDLLKLTQLYGIGDTILYRQPVTGNLPVYEVRKTLPDGTEQLAGRLSHLESYQKGVLRFIPAPDFEGELTLKYRVEYGWHCDSAPVIIKVTHRLPGLPELPGTPETPESPEEPEAPELPENPLPPELPAPPETPDVPEAPSQPESPGTPETPAPPQGPNTPNPPAPPSTPNPPDSSGKPDSPNRPPQTNPDNKPPLGDSAGDLEEIPEEELPLGNLPNTGSSYKQIGQGGVLLISTAGLLLLVKKRFL